MRRGTVTQVNGGMSGELEVVVNLGLAGNLTSEELRGAVVDVYRAGEVPISMIDATSQEVFRIAIERTTFEEDPLERRITWRSRLKGVEVMLTRTDPLGAPRTDHIDLVPVGAVDAMGECIQAMGRKHAAEIATLRTTIEKLRELLDVELERPRAS